MELSKKPQVQLVERQIRVGKTKINLVYGLPPNRASDTGLFLAHGVKSSMKASNVSTLHRALAQRGFLTVKFNFPFAERRWFQTRKPDSKNVLVQSYWYVIEEARQIEWKPRNLYLGGISLGAAVTSHVIADGPELPGVKGLFFLAYPIHLPRDPSALTDSHLDKINLPMLFVSGDKDVYAEEQTLRSSVSRLGPKATLRIIDSDHSFNKRKGESVYLRTLADVADIVADWAGKNSSSRSEGLPFS